MKSQNQFLKITGILCLSLTGHASLTGSANAQEAAASSAEKPQTLEERSGYAYGVIIGRQMKESGVEIDVDQFARALKDIFGGEKTVMSEDEIKSTFTESRQAAEGKKASNGLPRTARKRALKPPKAVFNTKSSKRARATARTPPTT